MMLRSFGQVRATMLRPGMRIGTIFNSQRVVTHDRVAKRDNILHLTVLCFVALKCCDHLARLKLSTWIFVGMLKS